MRAGPLIVHRIEHQLNVGIAICVISGTTVRSLNAAPFHVPEVANDSAPSFTFQRLPQPLNISRILPTPALGFSARDTAPVEVPNRRLISEPYCRATKKTPARTTPDNNNRRIRTSSLHLQQALYSPEPRPIQRPEVLLVVAISQVGGFDHHYERFTD